jgi:hypothetical protein
MPFFDLKKTNFQNPPFKGTVAKECDYLDPGLGEADPHGKMSG